MTMKLSYEQTHCESGSIDGKGIEWWWSGRDASGDMEAAETITEAVHAACYEEWGDHLVDDRISDLPMTAEVDWDGSDVENVTDIELNFAFSSDGLKEPESVVRDVQDFFTSPVTLDKPLQEGKNVARVGGKELSIIVA